MAWTFEGSYVESCSCNTPCPCTASLSLGADLDYCRAVLCFNIKSGDVEGVDVGGVGVVMIADSPKVMTDGNWKVGLWIDESASDEQADGLGKVFSGSLGGPPAALSPLLGEFLGVERAPIEFNENGLTHAVKIGDAVDVEEVFVEGRGGQLGPMRPAVGGFEDSETAARASQVESGVSADLRARTIQKMQ